MKTKKHIGLYILLTLLFLIGYIFLAAKPLGKEYHFTPEWKRSITVPPVQKNLTQEKPIYFKLGQSVGYFTSQGDILISKTFPAKASISSDYYSIYYTEEKNISFYDYNNQEKGSFEINGFPFFEEDRIYIFMPGGSSFAKCNSDGSVKWINENIMPITAFSSKKEYTAAGYADGTIKILSNENGLEKTFFAPGGSDYKVILGLDVSSDGNYIASLSGHDKQRFVVTQTDAGQPKIIYHEYLPTDLNRPTVVKFCDNDRQIIYNYDGYIGLYDIVRQKAFNLQIDTRVIAVEETDSLFYVLGKKDNSYTVYIIEKTQVFEGSFSFEAQTAFIKTSGNALYIGQDASISKVKISKE